MFFPQSKIWLKNKLQKQKKRKTQGQKAESQRGQTRPNLILILIKIKIDDKKNRKMKRLKDKRIEKQNGEMTERQREMTLKWPSPRSIKLRLL